jgi:hypothetical protein
MGIVCLASPRLVRGGAWCLLNKHSATHPAQLVQKTDTTIGCVNKKVKITIVSYLDKI